MSSYPMRDQISDHLLTPQNASMLIIDSSGVAYVNPSDNDENKKH